MKTLAAIRKEIKELNEKDRIWDSMRILPLIKEERKELDEVIRSRNELFSTIEKDVDEFNRLRKHTRLY